MSQVTGVVAVMCFVLSTSLPEALPLLHPQFQAPPPRAPSLRTVQGMPAPRPGSSSGCQPWPKKRRGPHTAQPPAFALEEVIRSCAVPVPQQVQLSSCIHHQGQLPERRKVTWLPETNRRARRGLVRGDWLVCSRRVMAVGDNLRMTLWGR